jgi:hypothetical protein
MRVLESKKITRRQFGVEYTFALLELLAAALAGSCVTVWVCVFYTYASVHLPLFESYINNLLSVSNSENQYWRQRGATDKKCRHQPIAKPRFSIGVSLSTCRKDAFRLVICGEKNGFLLPEGNIQKSGDQTIPWQRLSASVCNISYHLNLSTFFERPLKTFLTGMTSPFDSAIQYSCVSR